MKLVAFGNKVLQFGSKVIEWDTAVPLSYQRFMLVVNGNAIPGVDSNIMQLGGISINDQVGFNFITATPNTYFAAATKPENLVDDTLDTKWMLKANWTNSTPSAIYIFSSNTPITPEFYKLGTGDDSIDRNGSKNPGPRALYASTGTPTLSSDSSWKLLSYTDYALPVANTTWTSAMQCEQYYN